ncbi:hypothetical protein TSUD_324620 [Trifolium subterraneum]|uniref:Endonuclease/exonuclease/phosphatase domain-containing protein n=1 Tax=Trifolium subterraneum TaxID=3900 RepID=A0A2Z6PES7_TRISU|nr:hypothetical protein TSUD_324620 [Trifolium subterraneum]
MLKLGKYDKLRRWRCSDAIVIGNAVFSFCGPGFVGVCLEWGVARSRCFVVNVYSKGSFAEKKILWSNLVNHRRNLLGDVWCVVGDFNAVLDPSERRGGSKCHEDR